VRAPIGLSIPSIATAGLDRLIQLRIAEDRGIAVMIAGGGCWI